jgi:hypothetical protein
LTFKKPCLNLETTKNFKEVDANETIKEGHERCAKGSQASYKESGKDCYEAG